MARPKGFVPLNDFIDLVCPVPTKPIIESIQEYLAQSNLYSLAIERPYVGIGQIVAFLLHILEGTSILLLAKQTDNFGSKWSNVWERNIRTKARHVGLYRERADEIMR